MKESTRRPVWQRYAVAVGAVAAMTALRLALQPVVGTAFPMSTLYFAVMAAAWWGGLGPGLLAVLLSFLATRVFFMSELGRLNMPVLYQWTLMGTFVTVNVLVCVMVEALHRARRSAETREREMQEKHDALNRATVARDKAEAQLQHIVNSVRDFSIIAMDTAGCIVLWNTGAQAIFGYEEEEVLGRPIELIFTPEDRARGVHERELKEARERGMSEDERWHLRKDGTQFYGSGSVAPVRNGEGRLIGFTKVLSDATERWLTLRALRDSEESFKAVFNSVAVGMVQVDPQTGAFLRVNRCFCQITGYDEKELTSITFRDLTHPSERVVDFEKFQRMTRGEAADYLVDKRYVRKDGRVIWVHVSGVPLRDEAGRIRSVVGVVQDITERRQAELARAEAEERFRLAAEISDLGTWDSNHDTGEVHWSPRLREILGVPPDMELHGEIGWTLIHPEDRLELQRRIAAAMDPAGPDAFASEHRVVRPDGTVRWVQTRGVFLFSGEGPERRAVRGIGAALDITERKEYEARMQRREEAVLALATTQTTSLEDRIRQVTEVAAQALDVERVSVWLYTADRLEIECEDLYRRREHQHEHGERLSGERYPHYFAAVARGAPILADDAQTHSATAELREGYLESLGITSMLDVPIWVGGRHSGVICHEHIGPARHWSVDDQEFAASLATTVALALEAEQRSRAEKALAEAEDRLRLAAEAGGVGTFDMSFETGENYWSPEMYAISGLPAHSEVLLEQISLLIHAEDRDRVRMEIQQAIDPGGTGRFESVNRVARPDGAIRWVRVNGRTDFVGEGVNRRAVRALGAVLDITALKEAEEAARESGERFRTLADNIAQLAWMTNDHGWAFWHNQRWLDYVGVTQEEMQGWSWQKFVHPEHVHRVAEKFRHYIDRGEVWEDTYPLRSRDGSYRWFLSRAIPIRDAQGRVQRWFGTNTDVTEQRKREEELREVDRHRSDFLAMLGHELRNPLAAIRSALVLSRVENESFDWAMGVVDRQSTQLARLVDDLLDVSRITRGKVALRKERLEICEAVVRAVEATRPLIAQRGHQLAVDCPPHALWVEADPARLQQILGNLLTNAAKYTEPGGKIWVSATVNHVSSPSLRPNVESAAESAESSEEITITVRDTGVGIPPEKLPQMFEIFSQAERSLDRADGGLGLGLSIVKMLTEMHGGRVSASSGGLGKGSTFSIHLPAASAPTAGQLTEIGAPGLAAAEHSLAPPRSKPLKEQRVLVVDDNADAAEALGRLLRRIGCKLEITLDGPSALDCAHEFHPTTVLLDIGLPGMDGYEVARRLRAEEHDEHALLIAITGYGQEEDLRRSREAGFDQHLVKPVDIGEIKELLEQSR